MNLNVPALILRWKLAVPLDVLEHLEPWIRKIFAGRYAFLGFDRRCVLQWLEIWRTADLLYFEAREMIGWLEPGLFFCCYPVLKLHTHIYMYIYMYIYIYVYIYITLIAMISVCCKVRWSMGCSNEGCPKLAFWRHGSAQQAVYCHFAHHCWFFSPSFPPNSWQWPWYL